MPSRHKIPSVVTETLCYIITDTNNVITHVSNKFASLMEYTPEELIGKHPEFLKYPSPKHLPQLIMFTLGTTNKWEGILQNRTKSGEVKYLSASIHKTFNKRNKHTGYYAVYTDITHSIKTPHEYIFENDLMKLMFSNTDDYALVCLCESEYIEKQRILEISNKMITMIGLDKEYILNNKLSFTDIISNKSIYYKNLDLLIHHYRETPDNIIIEFDDVNGLLRKFKVNVVEFYYSVGHLSRLFTLTDVTKELEYSYQLDTIIRSKNDFLATISHDIKTPLGAISGFLTLLDLKETAKEKKEYIRIMHDSTRHLLDLTNDILEFTKIDNKSIEIVYHEFTPKDIQSTIEIFAIKGLEKNINFNVFMSPQLPEIMSQDIVRIKQIITNLIGNALKFVKDNGTIDVDCSYYEGKLHIIVEDDGIGISKDQIKKIFKPYTQGTNETGLIYGGYGIGLSVVKRLLDLMGGTITIDSELGKGSIFRVSIPTIIIKQNVIGGKFPISELLIFDNTFTKNDSSMLQKYLSHFIDGKITFIKHLDDIDNVILFITAQDVKLNPDILELSTNNKIIIIKKIKDTLPYIDNPNIAEISQPILGSKLYDVLNDFTSTDKTKKETISNQFDLDIKCKILVADDLHSNRLLLKELFSKYEIELDLVSNGEEAIKQFTKNLDVHKSCYDLIIMDMNMPVFDGAITAKQIRTIEQKNEIVRTPIIALTANRYEKNNEKLIDMDDYLPKPINFKHLLSMIIKYTSNQDIEINGIQTDKLNKLKEIKNRIISNRERFDIEEYQQYFNDDEYKLLEQMLAASTDKRTIKELYNKLMKLIRS